MISERRMEVRTIAKKNYNYPQPRVDIRTVHKLLEQGMSVQQIADKYGVSRQSIYQRLQKEEKKKNGKNTSGYGLDRVKNPGEGETRLVDPETGLVIQNKGQAALVIGRMGDERVTEFVKYHMAMMEMRQGVDKRNVDDLYNRFYNYLTYCAEHGIIPNNMNAYFAIGVARQDISAWHRGVLGTPQHRQFADDVMAFFASIHEQGAIDGVLNPISAMFWQKAHDGIIEATKVEVIQEDPLGDRRNAEQIAEKYQNIDLPD